MGENSGDRALDTLKLNRTCDCGLPAPMKEDELGDALPESAPGSGKSILCFGIEK